MQGKGITSHNKLSFRAQFEKCSRKAKKAMGVLEPFVQNQLTTPSDHHFEADELRGDPRVDIPES